MDVTIRSQARQEKPCLLIITAAVSTVVIGCVFG